MQIDRAGTAILSSIQQSSALREPQAATNAVGRASQADLPQSPGQTAPGQNAPVTGFPGTSLSAEAVTALQQTDLPQSGVTAQSPNPDTQLADPSAGVAPPPPPPPGRAATAPDDRTAADPDEDTPEETADPEDQGADGLSAEEEAIVRELEQRDAEVRRHEQAHAAAGGRFAGAPSYEYERGPNGQLYAVGGEVSIDTSAIAGDPEATIAKAQQVRRAALAPSQPSAQDQRVAAEAQQQISQARADLRTEQAEARIDEAETRRQDAEAAERTRSGIGDTATTARGEAAQTEQAVRQAAAADSTADSPPALDRPADFASRNLQSAQAFREVQGPGRQPGTQPAEPRRLLLTDQSV